MEDFHAKKRNILLKAATTATILSAFALIGCTDANVANSDPSNYEASAASESNVSRVTTAEVEEMVNDPEVNLIIIDVRNEQAYTKGPRIPGAVNLPAKTISEETAQEVIPTKDSPIAIYCRSGKTTRTAIKMLLDLGYQEIYEIGGITTNWDGELES